jgi:polysaccharide export outer membrane protein
MNKNRSGKTGRMPLISFINRYKKQMSVVPLCAGLAACAEGPLQSHPITPVTATVPSAVVSTMVQTIPMPPSHAPGEYNTNRPYVLGQNDVISVSVYLHPELSAPSLGTQSANGGVMVTSDGTVGLPLVGNVKVGGLTIPQAQQHIQDVYSTYINNPNVTVQLVAPQSLRYYLLGEFASPGVKYPGHALDLLDALSLGGSVNLANADLYQAYVAKGTQKLPIDLHALLVDGDLSQNIVLDSGDTIVIPPSSTEDAFVFGSVGKPGAVPFEAGSLSLLQALSVADMDLTNYSASKLGQIHIIRSNGNRADFIIVNAAKIVDGQALPFQLEPGDIVFVPANGLASWNQVMNLLLPSLNTINSILNPFVSIKYLSTGTLY